MIDVFFGESRTYISDTLMQKLGWKWGDEVWWHEPEAGLFRALRDPACDPPEGGFPRMLERDGKFFFPLAIPGVSRGRLNGARGVVGKAEHGVLVIDVRELLSPVNA